MAWPTLQDYNEAVQSPRIVFSDPELRDAAPETTKLGLPKGITGNFACVYRFTGPKGEWAVRCFHRRYAGQRQRYAEISRTLADLRLPYTVGFEYIDQGIRIRGQWYPILKMEWVKGALLSSYIERNLTKRRAIKALAAKWREMISALRDAGVAHGDLQHGNILIVGGEIRLVDYDGMYVPGLAGMRSNETGHPNYQHPHRSGAQFGPDLDNFSAWAIYVSLVALVADPTLWEKTTHGDEALIFRRADFEFPAQSRAFGLLKLCGDKKVRELAKRFREFGRLSLSQVPPLEMRPPRKPRPAPRPAPKPAPKPVARSAPAPAPAAIAPKPARAVKVTTSPPRGPSTAGRLARGLGRAVAGVFIGVWWTVRGVALGGYVLVRAVLWRGPKYAFVTLTGRRGGASGARAAAPAGSAPRPAPAAASPSPAPRPAPAGLPPRPAPGPAPAAVPARATPRSAPTVGAPRPGPRPPARRRRSGWGLVLAALWWPFRTLARGVFLLLRAVLWQAPRFFFAVMGRSYRKLPPRRRRRVKLGGALAAVILLAASLVWYESVWPTFFLADRPWLPPVVPVPSGDEEVCEFLARPGATLYIDGGFVSEEIPPIYRTVLAVGDHKVRFENTDPGTEDEAHETTIDVVKGKPARWVMNFVKGTLDRRAAAPVME